MITLTGKLRQSGPMSYTDKVTGKTVEKLKLWIEHETPRENGLADLKLEELFLEGVDAAALPPAGSQISLQVRVYAIGRDIKYSAVGLVGASATAKKVA